MVLPQNIARFENILRLLQMYEDFSNNRIVVVYKYCTDVRMSIYGLEMALALRMRLEPQAVDSRISENSLFFGLVRVF